MNIFYQVQPYAFGWLLLAATPQGICAVTLGDHPDELVQALLRDYPAASCLEFSAAPAPLAALIDQWLQALQGCLSGARRDLDLPLDVTGTPFQRRVWEELRCIPYGQTRTYTQVAAALGQPQAVRAVARACAVNKIAILIPCHRVVRADGSLAGYRWGMARKKMLLQMEKE